MSKKELKTNAMRILEKNKIPYSMQTYECDEFVDGLQTANILGVDHKLMYKTLVTIGKSKEYYVFVIAIEDELDMKKAARAVSEKSLEMLPLKDLTRVTGYVRGGCTSIGMKKQFKTVVDESAATLEFIYISGGKIGMQLSLEPKLLVQITQASFVDVIKK
ncbi:MAG: Cys-tRNA(Pro) deacylase [Eubacteriales bacterium]